MYPYLYLSLSINLSIYCKDDNPSIKLSLSFVSHFCLYFNNSKGAYSYKTTIGQDGPSYSLSNGRVNTMKESDGPGPGAYGNVSFLGKDSPAFTMSGRVNEKTTDSGTTLGPGNSSVEGYIR